jgi:hypothetical protein
MQFTRRRALAAAGLAGSTLLGGCFGIGGSDESGGNTPIENAPSSVETAAETTTGTTTDTANETATDTANETATPVAHADLADTTTAIVSEFEWFRTEYDAAIRGLVVRVNGVLGVIEDLDPSGGLSESDIEAFRAETTAVAEYVQSTLVDHFDVAGALRTGDNVYVQRLRQNVQRGDTGQQETVLRRARLFYERVIGDPYVRNEFSRRPVHDTLYSLLVPNDSGNSMVALASADDEFVTWAHPDTTEATNDDGVPQHTHTFDSGHRFFTHAHGHGSGHQLRDHTNEPETDRVYAFDGNVALLEDTELWRERMDDYAPALTGLFEPIQSDGRQQGVYLFVGTRTPSFESTPLYVERFESPEAATTAVEASLSGPVSSAGTESIAGREWEQIVYEVEGTSVYATRIRAGATLVTAGVSPTPWERRSDWSAALGPTWLGTE